MRKAGLLMSAGLPGEYWWFKLIQFRIFILLMLLSFEIGFCHLCRNENRIETPCYAVIFYYEDGCKHLVMSPFASKKPNGVVSRVRMLNKRYSHCLFEGKKKKKFQYNILVDFYEDLQIDHFRRGCMSL